jgi:hypothetical protein
MTVVPMAIRMTNTLQYTTQATFMEYRVKKGRCGRALVGASEKRVLRRGVECRAREGCCGRALVGAAEKRVPRRRTRRAGVGCYMGAEAWRARGCGGGAWVQVAVATSRLPALQPPT